MSQNYLFPVLNVWVLIFIQNSAPCCKILWRILIDWFFIHSHIRATGDKHIIYLFIHSPSAALSPSAQVQLAEAVLRPEGGAVAGLPAVGGLQLCPGDLRGRGGAAADAGAAHRHQAVAVWVRELRVAATWVQGLMFHSGHLNVPSLTCNIIFGKQAKKAWVCIHFNTISSGCYSRCMAGCQGLQQKGKTLLAGSWRLIMHS